MSRHEPTNQSGTRIIASPVGTADRLDRLPRTRYWWFIMLLASLGWLCLAYDIGLIGSVLPSLRKVFALTPGQTGLVAASSTLGIVIGIVPAGHLSDGFGRKRILIVGIIVYSVLSIISGLMSTWYWFAAVRLLTGIGLGATFPVPYTYMAELTGRKFRGAMTSILDAVLSIGYFVAPLLAIVIIPGLPLHLGWRVLAFIGGAPLIYALAVYFFLPESPRWLELHGHLEKAEAVTGKFEARAERKLGRGLVPLTQYRPITVPGDLRPSLVSQIVSLWTGGYWRRTLMLWLGYIGGLVAFYAFTNFMPTVLIDRHVALAKAFAFSAIINGSAVISKYLLAYLLEKIGRRSSAILYFVLAIIGVVVVAVSHSTGILVAGAVIGAAFGTASAVPFKAYAGELYPTRMRGVGAASMEASGRLVAGVLAPYIFALLLGSVGVGGGFAFVAVVLVVFGILPVALLAPETMGMQLEDASELHPLSESTIAPSI